MDPIMIEKLQAMERYSSMHGRKRQPLQTLFNYSLTTLLFGLFLSSPLWLPPAFSLLKLLCSMVFEPKCLFILCNVIIAVLVGQSKLSNSSKPPDIYDEYIEQNKRAGRISGREEAKGREEEEEGCEDSDEEGEKGLDELNRRVEDFIARVNKQRRFEARMVGLRG